jgi:hypothetical protein
MERLLATNRRPPLTRTRGSVADRRSPGRSRQPRRPHPLCRPPGRGKSNGSRRRGAAVHISRTFADDHWRCSSPAPQVPRGGCSVAKPGRPGSNDGLRAAGHLQLGEDVRDVVPDGVSGQAKPASDGGVTQPARDQRQHLPLPRCQLGEHRRVGARRAEVAESPRGESLSRCLCKQVIDLVVGAGFLRLGWCAGAHRSQAWSGRFGWAAS